MWWRWSLRKKVPATHNFGHFFTETAFKHCVFQGNQAHSRAVKFPLGKSWIIVLYPWKKPRSSFWTDVEFPIHASKDIMLALTEPHIQPIFPVITRIIIHIQDCLDKCFVRAIFFFPNIDVIQHCLWGSRVFIPVGAPIDKIAPHKLHFFVAFRVTKNISLLSTNLHTGMYFFTRIFHQKLTPILLGPKNLIF